MTIASAIITNICGRYRFTWTPFWWFEFDRRQAIEFMAQGR
jgi:hypothetical protein